MPRVSAIIPTYNSALFIEQAVQSVLAQTYADWELIIVDDGSTDNTRQILEPYLNRIQYEYQKNQGESVARNYGMRLAQGEYVAFLDSDDLWLPEKLAHQIPVLDANPEAVLAYSHSYVINAEGERIRFQGVNVLGQGQPGAHHIFDQLVLDNCVANPGTVVVRRACLNETTHFDPTIQWGEDWDLWLALALQGPFVFVPEPLACYRIRQANRRLRIEASDEFVRQNEIILNKVFARVSPERADRLALKPNALGALYLRSAIFNFELGDVERGARYLAQSADADPELRRAFVQRIIDEGFRIANTNGNMADGTAFVNRVFDHLPPALDLGSHRSYALSQLYVTAAFTEFERGNRRATGKYAIQSIRTWIPNLKNRGLLSISIQSLLGSKPWSR